MWLLLPVSAAQPLGENVIIAIALDISQLCMRPHPNRHPANRSLRDTRGCPAEVGNATEASPTAPTIASTPAAALPKTAGAKEEFLTVEKEAQHHLGIRSVTLSHLPLS